MRLREEDARPFIPFLGIELRRVDGKENGMEQSKELKEKLEQTETNEEAKKTIEDAGMILDDAELDQVAGGVAIMADVEA